MTIGCSVVIHDSAGRILIAQRSREKRIHPLRWENVGGHLEPDETPEECIRRETKEEIGCDLVDLQLLAVTVKTEAEQRLALITYTAGISGEIRLKRDEIEQIHWVGRAELDQFDFCFNCRKEIDRFFER